MSMRRAAFGNLAFSLGGMAINIVGGLLFVPFYLRHIDDATYGAWLASGGVVSMLGLFESGLATVFTQKLAVALSDRDYTRAAHLTGASIAAASVVGIVVAGLGGFVAWFAPHSFGCPSEQVTPLRVAVGLSAMGSGLMMLTYTLGAIPQALQRTVQPGIIFIIAMASGLGCIWLGLELDVGVAALGFGPLCTGLVMLVGHGLNNQRLWHEFGLPRPTIDRGVQRELWREARTLLLARVSGSVSSNLQAPAAALAVSAEASTILGLTGRIVSLVPLLTDRISTAVFAGVARIGQRSDGEREAVLREILTITTVLGGIGLGLALGFTESMMALWVGPQRFAGRVVLGLLLLSAFLTMRQGAYANLLLALGVIRPAARWLAADALLRLSLMVIMTPLVGLSGIPGASVLATAIVTLALARLLRGVSAIPLLELWLMGGAGFSLSLATGLGWWLLVPAPVTWAGLTWQLVVCASCMLSLVTLFDRPWRVALMHNVRAIHSVARSLTKWCGVRALTQ